MIREDMRFSSGADDCAAWFYPAGEQGDPAPVIVMAHGLTGTRRDRLGPFAERFAAIGVAALVFDYRGFGDSGGEQDVFEPEPPSPRHCCSTMVPEDNGTSWPGRNR